MEATDFLPIVSVLTLLTVQFGGWALLGFLTAQHSPMADTDPERRERRVRFFRAGHAHAGVLLILSLVFYWYLDRAQFSNGLDWLVGIALTLGILAQTGGYFMHMAIGAPEHPTRGTRLTIAGGTIIAVCLVVLAIGLIKEL
jgi:hypothetical protein